MSDQKSKSVLGKGLSALIPRIPERNIPSSLPVSRDGVQTTSTLEIEIARISPNPYQPRLDFDQRSLEELKQSIKQNGIIQPITVRKMISGTYELISGERRVRASQELGKRTIPAYIITVETDAEMLELGLIENLQRENLNPIEVSLSFKRLLDECNLTQDQVAEKVGKERSTVTNFLRLLKLPEKIRQGVRENKISMGHARALLGVQDEKKQLKLFSKIVEDGWSVRRIEDEVKGKEAKRSSKSPSKISTLRGDAGFQQIETRLRHQFGTKISIRKNASGGGEIGIEYYNADDLDRLIDLLES
ncbi:MAG: ParB/RepB/Spo0J family partition protein [Bacteriovoracaceae bacterium]|nr:ParB/RepB/Spo0J family partition protein [Bacteroidota bacterium]